MENKTYNKNHALNKKNPQLMQFIYYTIACCISSSSIYAFFGNVFSDSVYRDITPNMFDLMFGLEKKIL